MCMGARFAGCAFRDALGNQKQTIVLDESGSAAFSVGGGSVSVWVPAVR